MKKYTRIATTLAATLALATGYASAAGVWSTITWTDDSSLSFITTTNVTHSGDFNSAATVNGFTFETISISAGFSVLITPYSGSNFTIGSLNDPFSYGTGSAGVSGTASGNLSAGLIGFDSGDLSGTYTLTGLATNTNYAFYFFNPEWGGTNRTGFLDGSDDVGNTFAVDQSTGAGDKIIKYAYNTGASTSFTMTVKSNTAANSLHNYAFVNVVPGGSAYDTWASDKGLDSGNNGKGDDPDKDGKNNLYEFALDGNPLSGANDGKIVGKVAAVGADQVMTLTLPMRTGATFSADAGTDQLSALIDGIYYRIEGDETLASFADTITEVTGGDATTIQTAGGGANGA